MGNTTPIIPAQDHNSDRSPLPQYQRKPIQFNSINNNNIDSANNK